MTKDQIVYILNKHGFKENTWTTLNEGDNKYLSIIILEGDDNIFVNPLSHIFYFDTNENLLYVNKLEGKIQTSPNGLSNPVSLIFNNKTFYANTSRYSTKTNIGYVSDIHSFDYITNIVKR